MAVGVDVCKDAHDVAVGPQGEFGGLRSTWAGVGKLIAKLGGFKVEVVVIEATDRWEFALA